MASENKTTHLGLNQWSGSDYRKIADDNADNLLIDNWAEKVDASLSDLTYEVATGTATAMTLTIQTLVNGYAKTFIALASNGGSVTTINGKYLYKPNTTTAPNLIAGKAYTVWYNVASDCFFIKASGEGTALASDVKKTKNFTNDNDTGIQGTLDLSLLTTDNIRAGVTIDGVIGKTTVVDTSDASLDPTYLLTGYSGYDDGIKKAGTMPNLTGTRSASGVSKWADGGLAVYPERGYQKGGSGDGEIKVSVAQMQSVNSYLQPQYIVSGAEICGVNGSASIESLGGKKYASGTVVSSAAKMTFNAAWNDTDTYYYVNITGLSFTPNMAVIQATGCNVTSVNASHVYPITVSYKCGSGSDVVESFVGGVGYIIANGQLLVPVYSANLTYTYYIQEG